MIQLKKIVPMVRSCRRYFVQLWLSHFRKEINKLELDQKRMPCEDGEETLVEGIGVFSVG